MRGRDGIRGKKIELMEFHNERIRTLNWKTYFAFAFIARNAENVQLFECTQNVDVDFIFTSSSSIAICLQSEKKNIRFHRGIASTTQNEIHFMLLAHGKLRVKNSTEPITINLREFLRSPSSESGLLAHTILKQIRVELKTRGER